MVDQASRTNDDESEGNGPDRAAMAVDAWLSDATPVDSGVLEPAEQRRAADELLIHGLLSQLGPDHVAARQKRIERVVSAIQQEMPTTLAPSLRRQKRWWWSPVAAAALIVMAVAFLRPFVNNRQTAMAAVTAALQQAELPEDRHYSVEMIFAAPPEGTRTLDGQLWVRGATHYVLKHQGLLGELTVGSDGETYWLVPSIGPVVVGDAPGVVEQRLMGDRLTTPILQVTSILERLAHRYNLTLKDDVDLPVEGTEALIRCTHVLGQLRVPNDPVAPQTIELWVDEKSGAAQRLLLVWNAQDEAQGLQSVEFQLESLPEPTPGNWFEHDAHHASDRHVIVREPSE